MHQSLFIHHPLLHLCVEYGVFSSQALSRIFQLLISLLLALILEIYMTVGDTQIQISISLDPPQHTSFKSQVPPLQTSHCIGAIQIYSLPVDSQCAVVACSKKNSNHRLSRYRSPRPTLISNPHHRNWAYKNMVPEQLQVPQIIQDWLWFCPNTSLFNLQLTNSYWNGSPAQLMGWGRATHQGLITRPSCQRYGLIILQYSNLLFQFITSILLINLRLVAYFHYCYYLIKTMKNLILFFLVSCSLCLLKITSPIINSLVNNEIPYTLANFGQIHYGTTLKGTLATSTQSPDLCTPISSLNNSNTILLVQRGNCSFVKKVLNGQKAGAKMVIVSDNVIEDTEHITMVDDGNGRLVHIPSIFISEENGEILEKELYRSTIQMSIRFDITQTDTVNLTLYLNINDRHSAVLVRQLKETVVQLQSLINFNISYFSEPCSSCLSVDCYASLQTCMITPSFTGGSLIDIELRMYGIFLENIQKWFEISDAFDANCYGDSPYRITCFDLQVSDLKAKQKFSYRIVNKSKLLLDWQQDARISGIYNYPAAKVNGVKYLGNLDSDDVLEMVCASLKSPPMIGCGTYDYLNIVSGRDNTLATALWITLILIIVISLIILAIYIYKKTVKKEITNEMSLRVTEMVTQYIKLASANEKKSKDRELQLSRQDL